MGTFGYIWRKLDSRAAGSLELLVCREAGKRKTNLAILEEGEGEAAVTTTNGAQSSSPLLTLIRVYCCLEREEGRGQKIT